MNFTIIREKEYFEWHMINNADILKMGFEKACIFRFMEKNGFQQISKENIHEFFPFLDKNRFHELLDQLIHDGYIINELDGYHI